MFFNFACHKFHISKIDRQIFKVLQQASIKSRLKHHAKQFRGAFLLKKLLKNTLLIITLNNSWRHKHNIPSINWKLSTFLFLIQQFKKKKLARKHEKKNGLNLNIAREVEQIKSHQISLSKAHRKKVWRKKRHNTMTETNKQSTQTSQQQQKTSHNEWKIKKTIEP